MYLAKTRQSDGQSLVTSTLPNGRLHQRTNLVNQLQSASFKPFSLRPSHPVCGQSLDIRWQASSWPCTIWSSPWWRLLWKTHHPRNRTRSRVFGLYARNTTSGTDLPGTNQHLPSSVSILSVTTKSLTERISIQMPHRHQRCISSTPRSSRPRSVNSTVHHSRFSQRGSSNHFWPTFAATFCLWCQKSLMWCTLFYVCLCAFFTVLLRVLYLPFFSHLLLLWFLMRHACWLSSQSVQAIAIPICTFSLLLPWIMHKEELSIIILPGLLCTSTFWLDYCPSSSHPLKLKKVHLLHLLTKLNPIAVFTPLSHCQLTAVLPHWPPTEEFLRGLLWIQNHIFAQLLHSPPTHPLPFHPTPAIHTLTPPPLEFHLCYLFTLKGEVLFWNLLWNLNQNPVQCPPLHILH